MELAATDWFPEHLQNRLTPDAAELMRAWLAEACQINGRDWSAAGLMESLAAYVVAGMDDKDLGQAPRDFPEMPTPEAIRAAFASVSEAQQASAALTTVEVA